MAAFIANDFRIVSRILKASSPDEVITLLRTPLTGYWAERFTFGAPGERSTAAMSRSSAIILVINVAIPLLIAYGSRHGDEAMVQRAFEWLTLLPAESNRIVSMFAAAGIPARDAFTSQALIQLRRRYCETHSCLFCRIGHRLLSLRAKR